MNKTTLTLETVSVDAPAPNDFFLYKSGSDAALSDHARLAAAVCGTPLALVRIGDECAIWISHRFSMPDQRSSLETVLLSLAVSDAGPMVVSDAPADARLASHPAVIGEPYLRFFTSLPLPLPLGIPAGVLCVMDISVRQLTSDQADALQSLARRIGADAGQRMRLLGDASQEPISALDAFDDNPLPLAGLGDDPRSRLNLLQQRMESAIEEAQTSRLLFQQASHRFEELFQGVPVACVCLDEHGLIFEWNRAAEALYGVPAEQALLKTFWETICRTEDEGTVQALVMRSLDSQRTEVAEWQYPHPKDGVRDVLCSMFPLRGADGRSVGVISATVDITERKQAETALRLAEVKYRGIFENAVMGIFRMSPEGRYLSVNPALAQIFGYASPDEMIAALENHERDRQDDAHAALTHREFFERLRRQETISGFETQARRKDGELIWIAENARAVRDEDGRLLSYEGTLEDITGRKQAEESLMHSERRLREAQKAAKLGSWDYVPASGRLTWSEEVFTIFGVDPAAGVPDYEAFLRLIHATDRPAFDQAVRNAIEAGVSYEFDVRVRARDRSMRYVHATGRPIHDASGSVTGLIGTILDITERKRYERQLQDQRRQLIDANKKLEALATLDGLTGLKNHRAFQEMLEAEFLRFKRHGYPLSLLLLDVDHFKQYNDGFGHPAGDEVLKLLAGLLKHHGRTTDFSARYGGEEFAVILPNTDHRGAVAVAERLRMAVAFSPWPERAVTASIGAATATRAMAHRTMLVSSADRALYVSKRNGRNCTTHIQAISGDLAMDFEGPSGPG